MDKMTPSEEFVSRLCTKSFLSFWSYARPKGKKGKELCDILIVCDPDVIIFSVKEVSYKDKGNPPVDWQRWRREALEESYKQIRGAERWIATATNVVTHDGEIALPIPDTSRRRIHRVAVAVGSQRRVPFPSGGFRNNIVHVLDEISLDIVMNELNTITDFVQYLIDKEAMLARRTRILFASGGEEGLVGLYLQQGRSFPEGPTLIILDDDPWSGFKATPEYRAKKEADQVSYAWDNLIETLCDDYRAAGSGSDYPRSAKTFSEVEKIVRIMARENRFSRRLLAEQLVEFFELSTTKKVRSRIVPSPSLSDVQYVFLTTPRSVERNHRIAELEARCFVARGISPERRIVVGLGTERPDSEEGYTLEVVLLEIQDWSDEDQKRLEYLQAELGYFVQPARSQFQGYEYPPALNAKSRVNT